MAISDALRRLLAVRALEEEQHKRALDSAVGELRRVENALEGTRLRERCGREHVTRAVFSEDAAERIAGLVQAESAKRNVELLRAWIQEAGERAAVLREGYLAKRVERLQVESVIREAEAREAAEGARREQQSLDDGFAARRHAGSAHRQNAEKIDMKSCKESGPIPEEELRSKM